ncbi:MAG: hypothetical protein HUJ26_07015 [Planctomycetaceae bacterium]|nr:hypothetical protein [Planctomycetaceae bacterium]
MKYEIRELSVGGILDQAIKVITDNFGVLLTIMCVLQLPLGIASAVVTNAYIGNGQDMERMMQAATDPSFSMIMMILGLLSLAAAPITNAALVSAIAKAYLGQKPSVGESFSRAMGKIVPLFLTWILVGLAIMGGFILLIIPGILCIIWFALATQVVVLEPKSGAAALGRSKELMRGYAGKWFVLMIVLFVIGAGIGLASQSIGGMTGNALIAGLFSTVGQILAGLFSSAVLVVLYFSARCTHENFDLELLASSFGEQAPTAENTTDDDVWSES